MFMDGWMDTWIMFLSFNTKKNLQPHQGEIKNVKTAFYSSQKNIINLFQPVISGIDGKTKSYKFLDKNKYKKPKKGPCPKGGVTKLSWMGRNLHCCWWKCISSRTLTSI